MKKFTTKEIALIGVMAALVFAASKIQIPVPLGIGNTRIHLGNVCVLLAGIVLGGLRGGLAAGIGSAMFDLTDPLYISSTPFTFAFKFLMAFICGKIAHSRKSGCLNPGLNTIAAVCGNAAYIVLYLGRSFITDHFLHGMDIVPVLTTTYQKAGVSSINGVIAVICAVPLGLALNKALSLRKI